MKLSATVALAAAGSLAAAQGHNHAHRHFHKRDTVATSVVDEVVTVYELDGTPIPVAEVCQGIADKEYEWADGQAPSGACVATSTPAPSPTSIVAGAAEFIETSSSSSVSSSSTSTTPTSSAAPTSSSSSSSTSIATASSKTSSSSSSSATGVDSTFPDGELDCDSFPSDYGAVALDYIGLGGWSGIQYVTLNALESAVESIVTAVSGQGCTEGAMCSYQCPEGYLKSQWPSTQGSTGQSIGGVTCTNGKLVRTNKDFDTLCVAGVQALSVQNKLDSTVCLCRTDYPGKFYPFFPHPSSFSFSNIHVRDKT